MSIRLATFKVKGSASDAVKEIVAVLNNSYLRAETSLGILNALAAITGEDFRVLCVGDFNYLFRASESRGAEKEYLDRVRHLLELRRVRKENWGLVKELLNSRDRLQFYFDHEEMFGLMGGYCKVDNSMWTEQELWDGAQGECILCFTDGTEIVLSDPRS